MDPYDCDFTLVRPRTTGYSPGHVRSLAKAQGVTLRGAAATASALDDGRRSTGLPRAGTAGPGAGTTRGSALGSAALLTSPVQSSTARRIAYCNDLHEETARRLDRRAASDTMADERCRYDRLSIEVETGIDGFERNLASLKAKGWKGV